MTTHPLTTTRREWTAFLALTYGLTILMGIPLAYCQRAGYGVDVFPNAQMFYPAAGAMAALLLARPRGELPLRFFVFHLAVTAAMVGMCVAATFMPGVEWAALISLALIATSLVGWVVLLTENKQKREAAGLRWHGGFLPFGLMLLFILLKTGMAFTSVALGGAMGEYLAYWTTATPWIFLAVLPLNFFLSFLPFLGEEYGWRYWLQPRLQQRFGARWGVLLLGVAWGLWHLPLNLFYYSPETSLQSITAQLITCVGLGAFMAYAYLKTNNIWVPVVVHFLNNNLIPVLAGTTQLSNQIFHWWDMLPMLLLTAVFFLPFLASRVFQKEKNNLT